MKNETSQKKASKRAVFLGVMKCFKVRTSLTWASDIFMAIGNAKNDRKIPIKRRSLLSLDLSGLVKSRIIKGAAMSIGSMYSLGASIKILSTKIGALTLASAERESKGNNIHTTEVAQPSCPVSVLMTAPIQIDINQLVPKTTRAAKPMVKMALR
jgi:hypothetical protein